MEKIMQDKVDNLATALAKAQSSSLLAKEDSKNPYFKSSYANLAQVWASCRKALTENGLSVAQMLEYDKETKQQFLKTRLLHSSGEYLDSVMPLNPLKNDPQAIGAYLTYMRRYMLAALVGVAPGDKEDDDAERAMKSFRKEEEETPAPAETTFISPQHAHAIEEAIEILIKPTDPAYRDRILKNYKIESFSQLPQSEFSKVDTALKAKINSLKKSTSSASGTADGAEGLA
jgi:hypothetical protein